MGVEQILSDFQRLQAECDAFKGKKVLVGIVGAGGDAVKIAHAHEYGTGRLPARSFIRASFDADQDKLEGIISEQVERVVSGKTSADAAINAIGAQAAQLVQNYIDENRVTPASNFAHKTQHTTLYETGTHIRDRIAYEVVNE